jgi:allophanate hydrolase subunit 1
LENNNIEEEKKETINIIFEDLEKDKYYYDNYVYIDKEMKNHQEKLKDKIKLLNDYSIDKMKNVNYFSYSSLLINYKKNMKNKNIKRVLESDISHINEEKNEDIIDIEENIQYNNNNKSRLSKNELLNKISNMKN